MNSYIYSPKYHFGRIIFWISEDNKAIGDVEGDCGEIFGVIGAREGLNNLELGCFVRLFGNDEVSDLGILVLVEHVLEILQRNDVSSLGIVRLTLQVLVAVVEGDLV